MYGSHQIAGVIGTGLFLGLGQLLVTTGPLGVLLVFLLVGSVAFAFVLACVPYSRSEPQGAVPYSSIVSVTEMAVFAPVSGSFSHYGVPAIVQSNAVDNPWCFSCSLGRSRVGFCRKFLV
jgi:amino acid permease